MSIRHLILPILACASTAWAGSASFTVEGAADYALKRNPALAAARLRIEEARGRVQQSGRLSNPELELDFSRNTRGQEGSASIALMQRFPLTSRLRYEKEVSRAELSAAEAEVRDAERKLAAEVRTAATKLLALEGQRELLVKQIASSRELLDFLVKRAATAEASQIDVSQVELETSQIEIERMTLNSEEAALDGELRGFLGLTGGDGIKITGEIAAPKSAPVNRDVAGRADILAAEWRAEAARAAVLEQRARRWEDVGIGLSYTRERTMDEPEPIETEQMIGFRFSLPLPIWNDNSGKIREAQAAAARAQKEIDATRVNARAEVSSALGAMSAYARLIGELDDKVLPAAVRVEDQVRSSYATGQTPLTDVLRARTRRLELERQRLDALRDYQLARIRHASALGGPIPRKTGGKK